MADGIDAPGDVMEEEGADQPAPEKAGKNTQPGLGDETADDAATRLEGLLDASFEDWRERVTWRFYRVVVL